MNKKEGAHVLAFLATLFFMVMPEQSSPTTLPKATLKILEELKLNPKVLGNVDEELQVPKEWIDKAKQESKVKILSTSSTVNPAEIRAFYSTFKERYPFIRIEQSGASMEARVVKTLLAYKYGKVVRTDVLTNLEHALYHFKKAGALEDLRNVPTWNVISDGFKASDGSWVSPGVRHYCLAYNTKRVKTSDLPKSWDDLVTNTAWGNGNIGLVNRPQNWVLGLWKSKGAKWSRDFLTRLFRDQKPQLRKEGMNASLELAAAGEFHITIPAGSNLVSQKVNNGSPLGFVCLDPIPTSRSEFVILKGAENPFAARIFINWLLSTEGQISQFYARSVPPAHKGLNLKELVPYGNEIIGKELSHADPAFEREEGPEIFEFWKKLWMRR